jgi:hypothetical protein
MRFFTISRGLDQINRSVRGMTVFRPPVPALISAGIAVTQPSSCHRW